MEKPRQPAALKEIARISVIGRRRVVGELLWNLSSSLLKLFQTIQQLLKFNLASGQRSLQILHDLRRSLAQKRLVRQPRLFRLDILRQTLNFLSQSRDLGFLVHGVAVSDP